MENKKIIQFPTPKVKLTEEETIEYNLLKERVENANTLREIRYLKKEVKEFLEKVNKRLGN